MSALERDARFAAALDDCCDRVHGGEPLERCLPDYPVEYREELALLVPQGRRIERLRRDPSPEFQARLEGRLLASVDETRRARQAGLASRIGRLFAGYPAARVAALVLVLAFLVGSGAGVDQAAADSLPDSPLYQVKTAREWVQLALARDPGAQVDVHAAQITERGRELNAALRADKPRRVVALLTARLARSTDQMVGRALERQAQGNPQPAARALVAIRTMERLADRLEAQASPDHRPVLRRLQGFLQQQELRLTGAPATL